MSKKDKGERTLFRPTEPFTKEAKERWSRIPKSAQEQILENVFCGRCLCAVPIVLQSAAMKGDNLILRGKCRVCGHEVCRVVEPEN